MKCFKTVLISIACVFALFAAAVVCFVPPILAAAYVDQSLGYGRLGGVITLGCCLAITLGVFIGVVVCVQERGR